MQLPCGCVTYSKLRHQCPFTLTSSSRRFMEARMSGRPISWR